ncbi:hypothetical protein PIROE2DRAFT_11813 [Piromyces sp. E2]|nr:hypothetical protein PIROE2DRAFT_11813 [Piromyces sp. E2]|eukprot:OUM61997.1 hypothetical protein PIROE2DRAFT_11813 [Piromyces sp. E2]
MKILNGLLFNIIFSLLLSIKKSLAKEFNIKYNDDTFKNLKTLLNQNQNDDELILRFVDKYYIISYENLNVAIGIEVSQNITFIGENKETIFDFNNRRTGYNFSFKDNNKGYSVKFENIIFKNYFDNSVGLFRISSFSNNFLFLVENCTFQNNKFKIFDISIYKSKIIKEEELFIINNCNVVYV